MCVCVCTRFMCNDGVEGHATVHVWRTLYGDSSFFLPLFGSQGLKSDPRMKEAT